MSNLLDAAINGEWEVVKSLIDVNEDINSMDVREGSTTLMYAVIDEENEVVKSLLENGANVNLQDDRGYTALHFASQNFSLDTAKLLSDYRANANIQDKNGNTPLSNAVFYSNGKGEMIQLLLKFGADINIENNHGVHQLNSLKQLQIMMYPNSYK